MLMLVNDKAKWGIIVQGKDYEIEDLKERLLSCELIMSRLRTEL